MAGAVNWEPLAGVEDVFSREQVDFRVRKDCIRLVAATGQHLLEGTILPSATIYKGKHRRLK